jgi:lipoyl-dependent peroxiredoxin
MKGVIANMTEIQRSANAVWEGDLRGGKGKMSTQSGVLNTDAYGFSTRFENEPGTNPEELIAAAHAGCFTMNLSGVLGRNGFNPQSLMTQAVLTMEKLEAGFTITKIRLEVEGQVPGIDEARFKELADQAERTCPISRLLRPGLQSVEVVAKLK